MLVYPGLMLSSTQNSRAIPPISNWDALQKINCCVGHFLCNSSEKGSCPRLLFYRIAGC